MTEIVDGRYRLEAQLAAGGFGTVFRATDLQLGRAIALKVLHRELARDASIVARFRREAAALAKLKSPHTVTIYDIGQTSESLYMAMELLRGESLADVLARTGVMPWRRAARIARDVCSSLSEAHGLGIVHRDLKPANIVLEQHVIAGELVKVVDFGIAKGTESSALAGHDITLDGQTIGTFDYMSPEQLVGETCTPACDVFTLGVVLYELLAGMRPFAAARNPAQMLVALATERPRPLTNAPGALSRIVLQCLSRDPSERPSIAYVDAVLEQLLVGGVTIADEATVVAAIARPTRGHGSLVMSQPAPRPAMMRVDVRPASMAVIARGSDQTLAFAPTMASRVAAIADDIEDEITHEIDDEITAVAAPPVHESAPRWRLAEGTAADQLVTPSPVPAAQPHVHALDVVRYLTIAVCLFGIGFVLALAVWSM